MVSSVSNTGPPLPGQHGLRTTPSTSIGDVMANAAAKAQEDNRLTKPDSPKDLNGQEIGGAGPADFMRQAVDQAGIGAMLDVIG